MPRVNQGSRHRAPVLLNAGRGSETTRSLRQKELKLLDEWLRCEYGASFEDVLAFNDATQMVPFLILYG